MADMGRPSEYDPSYIAKADEYLALCVDEEFDWTKTDGDKTTSYEHRVRVKLPTIEGFARFLNVSRKSLYNWAEEHEDFLHTLEKIEVEQKERLIKYGLSGDYNPTIAKLILSANHNMREKSDMTSNDKPITGNTIVFKNFKDAEPGSPADS
jgi:hypothetical protein